MHNKKINIIFGCIVIILGIAFVGCKDDSKCKAITSSSSWDASKVTTCTFITLGKISAYTDYIIDTNNSNSWNFDNIMAHCEASAVSNACNQPDLDCRPVKIVQGEECTALFNSCTHPTMVLCLQPEDENGTTKYSRIPAGMTFCEDTDPVSGMNGTEIKDDNLTCDIY